MVIDEGEDEDNTSVQQINSQEFFKSIANVRNYAQSNCLNPEVLDAINYIEKQGLLRVMKDKVQLKITKFFQK